MSIQQQQGDDERRRAEEEAWPHPKAIAKWYADFIGTVPHRPRAYHGTMDDFPCDGDIRTAWGAGYTHPKERE